MRFLKMWFLIPLLVFSLAISNSMTIYAMPVTTSLSNLSEATKTVRATTLADIEKIIKESMRKRENNVVIKYRGKTEKLLDKISGYIGNTIAEDEYLNYSYRSANMSYRAYGTDITITIAFSYYETAAEIEYVDQEVKRILSKIITPNMNNHEKVKVVHDYLVSNLAYDTRLKNNSPYSALKEGVTACNGYAMLVYKMLSELGISVRLISGVASSEAFRTQNHAWNLVQLDGHWYHLDVTWDDPIPDDSERILYDYFLLTDKEISKNHHWEKGGINGEEKPYPASSTTTYFELLNKKMQTTNEADRYFDFIHSLDMQYLLPEYTATSISELNQLINKNFGSYKKDFSIRYIDSTGNLSSNLRQCIYNNALSNKVKSWSYGFSSYMRGTTAHDQLISIMDVVYLQAPPPKTVEQKVEYPTRGFTSIGTFVNVEQDKVWTIECNGEIDYENLKEEQIYIINSVGEKLNSIEISMLDVNRLLVKTNIPYQAGETYYLYVKGIQSVYGEPLMEPVSIKFTTKL